MNAMLRRKERKDAPAVYSPQKKPVHWNGGRSWREVLLLQRFGRSSVHLLFLWVSSVEFILTVASGSNVRMAMQFVIVSATQTNTTTSLAYSNSNWNSNILAACKSSLRLEPAAWGRAGLSPFG